MSNHKIHASDHDEIVAVLPWFVNHTLEEEQRIRVSNHIENCADCRSEVQFLNKLTETVQNDARNVHTTHADVDKSLAGVMDRIDAKSQQISPATSALSWLQQKLAEMFQFATALPFPQWSATALAGLLVAVLGFQLYDGQVKNEYSVLSASDIENPSIRMSVELTAVGVQKQVQSIIQFELEKLDQPATIRVNSDGDHIIAFNGLVEVSELSNLVAVLENEAQIERVRILP